jgi:hypothetical protein
MIASRLRAFALAALTAVGLLSSVAASFAQPAPVPALPDAERRTSYSISASTCNCAVGMQLYGDSTDVANWIQVVVNGVQVLQPGNWTITSPSGPISTLPRPITDAVLTFTTAKTGTVQIVGARRPRRTSQLSESRGVAARDFNQIVSDIIATQRENWDKTNDVTGRAVLAPPGETLALLPIKANRVNQGACFDNNGYLTSCVAVANSTFIAGNGITFTGLNPTTISTTGDLIDKSVTLAKLYHPSAPSLLLGTDSNAALTITGAANNGSGLIRLTVASTTTFATGQQKTVSDVLGTIEANATWTITVIDATHIDLQGSAFAHAYVSGGTIGGGVEEITLGAGLIQTGSVLAAPGFAPPGGSFKGLSIKTNTTTAFIVVADFVTLTDGTNYMTLPISGTCNMALNGAVNRLDTGTIAAATWYAVWAIAKADGTQGVIASLSATAPTMPSGYTFKARIGWTRTVTGTATLHGIYQLGRRAQYVLGVGSTTLLPSIINQTGSIGNVSTPTYVGSSVTTFVPSTSSVIYLAVGVVGAPAAAAIALIIAPNGNYGAFNSTTNMAPITSVTDSTSNQALNHGFSASLLLETQNIFVASSTAGGNTTISTLGWDDNL